MREILFRGMASDRLEAKSKSCKYGFYKTVGDHHKIVLFDDQFGWMSYEVDPKTVGQYIGRKDKNGVKIFDGDNVRLKRNPEDYGGYEGHNYVCEVKYCDDCAMFFAYHNEDNHLIFDEWCTEEIEVIGNLPELLQGDCSE